ncbi:hypothetical protein Pst134EB_021862, partial [Puccinia striiformis f. sp. tritici]
MANTKKSKKRRRTKETTAVSSSDSSSEQSSTNEPQDQPVEVGVPSQSLPAASQGNTDSTPTPSGNSQREQTEFKKRSEVWDHFDASGK